MIGIQLDLFGDPSSPVPAPGEQEPEPGEQEPAPARPQLDLFADRHLQLEHARRALAEGRADDACRELAHLHSSYPDDPAIAAELAFARALDRRLREIDAMAPADRPRCLVELARAQSSVLRAMLLGRAARELAGEGPAALVDGKPASVLLLETGDLHAAHAAAEAAVRESPRARFLAYLADVEHRLAEGGRARERYRQALVLDPHDVDWDELADEEVRSLPDIARTELELPDGIAWAAPVGVVLGILPIGEPPPPATSRDGAADRPPSALDHARAFLAALFRAARARDASTLDARREMKALAPQLFAAYLARRAA